MLTVSKIGYGVSRLKNRGLSDGDGRGVGFCEKIHDTQVQIFRDQVLTTVVSFPRRYIRRFQSCQKRSGHKAGHLFFSWLDFSLNCTVNKTLIAVEGLRKRCCHLGLMCASIDCQPGLCRRYGGLPCPGFPCHHPQVSSHT